MSSTINFHHLISWLDAANFAHGISQCFNIIHAWFQSFRVWCQAHHIPATWRCHAGSVIFTQVIAMWFRKSCQWSKDSRGVGIDISQGRNSSFAARRL
jgi:hypothetical protein